MDMASPERDVEKCQLIYQNLKSLLPYAFYATLPPLYKSSTFLFLTGAWQSD